MNAAEIDIAVFAAGALWAAYNAAAALHLALTPDRPRAAVAMACDRVALLVVGAAVLTASVTAHWWPELYADVARELRRLVEVGLLGSAVAYGWWRRST